MLFDARKKIQLSVIATVLAIVMCGYFILTDTYECKQIVAKADVLSQIDSVDYDDFFSQFEGVEIEIDAETHSAKLGLIANYDPDIYSDGYIEWEEVPTYTVVRYEFDYCVDTNEFWLAAYDGHSAEEEALIERVPGVAFLNENEEIDVAFDLGDRVVYLSELQESGQIQTRGFLSTLLGTVIAGVSSAAAALIVGVVVVAAVVVVACALSTGAGVTVPSDSFAPSGPSVTPGTSLDAAGDAAVEAIKTAVVVGGSVFLTITPLMTVLSPTTAAHAAVSLAVSYAVARSNAITREEEIEAAKVELRRRYSDPTFIFRNGEKKVKDLTPEPNQEGGLSMLSAPSWRGPCVMFVAEIINATPILQAVHDGYYYERLHYSITPLPPFTLEEWKATHPGDDFVETEDMEIHPCTAKLLQIGIPLFQ